MAIILVHVVPRARKTEVTGRHGEAIRIRIAAPPAEGAGNAELRRFLAERLGVPRSAVTIVHGATARRKTVEVTGLTREAAEHALLTSDV